MTEAPEMQPDEVFVPVPGGRIFTLQWGEGPTLLFTHATGMCARAYLDLLWPLGSRFRVIAQDARGHGRTELEADPQNVPWDWKIYRQDLVHLVAALGGGPVRLAGHSFGATCSFEAAAETPGLAVSACLIDPPMVHFDLAAGYRAMRDAGTLQPNPMAVQALRRRSRFDDAAAAQSAYRGRGVFAGWPDRALDDYLQGGLLPDGDCVRLACTPAWESASYCGVSATFEASAAVADFPVTLLLAGENSTVQSAEEERFRALQPAAVVERFPGTGHFLPVTHPHLVRPYLKALA